MSAPDSSLVAFGLAVREVRKARALTQADAAEALGISRTYLGQIENGQAHNLTFRLAREVADLFGLGLFGLLFPGAASATAHSITEMERRRATLPAPTTVEQAVREMEWHRGVTGVSNDDLLRACVEARGTLLCISEKYEEEILPLLRDLYRDAVRGVTSATRNRRIKDLISTLERGEDGVGHGLPGPAFKALDETLGGLPLSLPAVGLLSDTDDIPP